jgi:hypothetical protein
MERPIAQSKRLLVNQPLQVLKLEMLVWLAYLQI